MIPIIDRVRSRIVERADAGGADGYGNLAPFVEFLRGAMTDAGVRMNARLAMRISEVRRCVKLNSDGVATLPMVLYRRLPTGGKERAAAHPYYRLLRTRPSFRHTSVEWLSLMQRDVELHGNAIARIVRIDGRVEQLLYTPAHRVQDVKEARDGSLTYHVRRADSTTEVMQLPQQSVLHIRGPFGDGAWAASVVHEFKDLFGLAWALQCYLAFSFANGVRLSGAIKSPNALGDKAYGRLVQWMKDEYEGVQKTGKVMLLEEGLDWVNISQSNRDAQTVELWDKITAAIARVFDVPLHMLASHIAQPRANMEQQGQEYLNHALRGRLVRWEQRLGADLLDADPGGEELFFESLIEDLLRGDTLSRFKAYTEAVSRGFWMTPDEVRVRENLNPIGGRAGELFSPLNMAGANSPPPDGDDQGDERETDDDDEDADDDGTGVAR